MANQRKPSTSNPGRWLAIYTEYILLVGALGRLPRETTAAGASSDEARLASWARYQRRRLTRGVMLWWQRELLEAVPGFVWEPLDERWRDRCEELSRFLTEHRRMPRYRASSEGERALAAWVHKQRHHANVGRLPHHRIEALQRLPFRIV